MTVFVLLVLMSILILVFVVAYFLNSDFRKCVEEPKLEMLEQEKRFRM